MSNVTINKQPQADEIAFFNYNKMIVGAFLCVVSFLLCYLQSQLESKNAFSLGCENFPTTIFPLRKC